MFIFNKSRKREFDRYNKERLSTISDNLLNEEREEERIKWCHGEENEIRLYDNELERRAKLKWKKDHPDGKRGELPRREHGWYLPNDD